MTSIFGTTGFFDSDKVQNQQATPGYTNFTGTLANNGAPIYATGGPFLPLAGGTMSGSIDMGGTNTINSTYQMELTTNGDVITPPVGSISIFNNGSGLRFVDSSNNTYVVATTGDLASYLPLAGGTMSGSIDMGGQEVQNCSAYRISNLNMKTIIGSSVTTSGSNYTTQCGGVNTIDGSSVAATSFGYGNTVTTSSGPTLLGSALTASNAFASIVIGNTSSATGCTDSIVIGHSASSTADYAHAIGYNIANSTANSLLVDCSSNIRSNSTTCDLGTTAKPFQNLYLNGLALSSNVSKSIPTVRCTLSDTTIGFGSTTTETSVIQGTLSGSLTIPAPTAAGFTMKMSGDWLYSAGALTTFTVRFKVNGTTVLTTTIPAGVVVNQDIHIEHTIQLRTPSNRLYVSCQMLRGSSTPVMNGNIADSVWLPSGSNTISLTGQFNDTSGTWRGDSFDLWSSYAS